jgi:hypothetical protein
MADFQFPTHQYDSARLGEGQQFGTIRHEKARAEHSSAMVGLSIPKHRRASLCAHSRSVHRARLGCAKLFESGGQVFLRFVVLRIEFESLLEGGDGLFCFALASQR